jgi:hypothetical protein
MAFCIRENDPYNGRVTLYFIPGGAFVATKKVVSERDFLVELLAYLRRRSPHLLAAPTAKEPDDAPRESPLPARNTMRLKKRVASG